MLKKIILFILFLYGSPLFSQNSGGRSCSQATPFCSDNNGSLVFQNVTNAQDQGRLGCLDTTPNPSWFFIRIEKTGNLQFRIVQNTSFDTNGNPVGEDLDVDFIAWGPFSTPNNNCANLASECNNGDPNRKCVTNNDPSSDPNFYVNNLDNTNIIDCSYSSLSTETFSIQNASEGEFYMLLITNFKGNDGFIQLVQTNFGQANSGLSDCSIISEDLGADQNVCNGSTITLDATSATGNVVKYEWFLDTGTGFNLLTNQTNATLVINNNISGKYKVKITDDLGSTKTDEVVITFYPIPTATQPTNLIFCDADNDGFNSFDLQADKNTEILNGLDSATFDVLYFLTQADADANINAITNPYTNPTTFSNQTIYARVHNKNAPTACFATTFFTLAVTGLPTPQTPTDYTICDDATVGTDTDGFINHFKLNTKDTEVLGTLDPAIYKVSYHTTLVGAQTDNTTNLINKTINYTNTIANSQPIYVRVENVNNTNCNDTSKSFNLIVNPLPIITTNVELKQCDNDVDGFTPFNLNEAATDISVNHANETFTFFPTLADAVADNNQIPNPTTFVNRVIPSDKVWARATSTFGCYRISEIKLTVSTTGIPATFQKSFNTCDDFLDIDGNNNANNNDTDGISTFNFNNVTAEVIAIFPANQQLTVTYYKNENDALAEENPIADPANYRNIGYPNTQNIYIRVDSNLDNDCLGFGHHITLTVDKNPTATPVTNLEICDDIDDGDGTNGIVQTFNLTNQTTTILGTQNPANFTVTYHTSKNDANAGTNAIPTPNAYTNTTRDKQTVYVRVTNNNGGCFTDHTSFDLIVNPLPIANFAPNIEICDDDSDGSAHNGFSQTINLENNTNTVLGTQDPTIFSVTYHRSLADAQSGSKPLLSPYTNKTQNREKIWVRVYNANTGCANGISNFDVIINPEPIPNPQNTLSNLSYCDDDNGGIASDTDAIYENIDLESQIPDILGADNTLPNYQNPDDFTVTFHKNQADASSGNNPFASPYTNTNRTETIFVRIENKATHCSNDDVTFQVIINQLPDFQVTSPQIVCLNKLPKNIAIENPDDVYDYQWKDENGTTIGTNNTSLDISVGGVYSVTATTTNGTNCSRTRTIQVNESIIATLVENDITIIDDSDNNTITINSANNHLGVGKYEFALTDQKDNFIRTYQDDPVFENLDGNIYKVLVRDKNDCGEVSLLVPVIEIPKFFTPNSDGINDIWKIKGVNTTFFPVSKIVIFDRYGKAVGNIKTNDQGWNGNYNGKILPSDDYWFSIKLVDANGIKRERKGHFSLLRK